MKIVCITHKCEKQIMLKPITQLPSKKTWIDRGILKYLIKEFKVSSILDIGCGRGGLYKECIKLGVKKWVGIEGDKRAHRHNKEIILHDYRTGLSPINDIYDLGWCIEFLEHLEERYIKNVLPDLLRCKYLLCTTHPPPRKPRLKKKMSNNWHVNEQPTSYWIELLTKHGLTHSDEYLLKIKESGNAPRRKHWVKRHGMFFINESLL
ncbi:hypothetical protein LCGC14_2021050 [marine sediment metagenome]|uniref:Methyltransferase type 11 domain-containing protein n=1 Tax=marine sediment metagenome TaxID=412755 RepID=A0A0F9HAW4_9ZZZZ